MQPADFRRDAIFEWCEWVLAHGLPDIPARIEVGESIPVAYWAGADYGAVTVIARYEPDPIDDGDPHVDEDVCCYRRTGLGWVPLGPDGGTNRPRGADLSPLAVDPNFVGLGGSLTVVDDGWRCRAIDGIVGRNAAWIEVVNSGIDRQAVVAPIGVVVVCVPWESSPQFASWRSTAPSSGAASSMSRARRLPPADPCVDLGALGRRGSIDRVSSWVGRVAGWRGRWIGRKDATVAGSRGIGVPEARRILAERAGELHGPMLDGFWRGVSEIRPEWTTHRPGPSA